MSPQGRGTYGSQRGRPKKSNGNGMMMPRVKMTKMMNGKRVTVKMGKKM